MTQPIFDPTEPMANAVGEAVKAGVPPIAIIASLVYAAQRAPHSVKADTIDALADRIAKQRLWRP